MTSAFPDDQGLVRVLTSFGIDPRALLGHGGEAWVYALDDDRVIRVLHDGSELARLSESAALVCELTVGNDAFALPELLDVGEIDGRVFGIERRLRGRPVGEELGRLGRRDRDVLVERYVRCAAQLGDLHLEARPWWGDLLGQAPVRTATWGEYLVAKADAGLTAAGPPFADVDPVALAAAVPEASIRSFVHLDAFPGNVLAAGTTITAVIDFGLTCAVGDRRLDPLAAVVYLTPAITPTADDRDRAVARSCLVDLGLDGWFDATQRWLAAYWAFATDDRRLHEWCLATLG